MNMSASDRPPTTSIGRIVSVTGSKAIVLLDGTSDGRARSINDRPEMGTLLAIDTANTIVLAIVSALSVPVPAQREGDTEIWIAELGLVGELWKSVDSQTTGFNRGVTVYPALGDRVRVASKAELEIAFCGDTEPLGARRLHPPGQLDPGHGPRRRPARQALRHSRHHRHRQVVHHRADPALHPREATRPRTSCCSIRITNTRPPSASGREVISPRNMQLPFWLLNFEEIVEVLIGDPERKAEIEILQELIPIAKSRYSSGRDNAKRRPRSAAASLDAGRYHRRHARSLPHLGPDQPHRRAHGQAREQAAISRPTASSRTASTRSRRTAATASCSAR